MSHDNEHDRLAKAAFGRAAGARALLATVLPAEVTALLDLETLAIGSVDVVGDLLDEGFADLVFSVESRGQPLLLEFLIEHKSSQRRFTILDLFASVGRLWQDWRRKNRKATTVPRIVPIVLYHGERPWTAPRAIQECFGGGADATACFASIEPTLPVVFVDLRERSRGGDDLADAISPLDAFAAAALWLLEWSRDERFLERLEANLHRLGAVRAAPCGEDDFRLLVRYVVMVVRPPIDARALARLFGRGLGAEAEDTMMSLGQSLIEQGIERGIEQGIEVGRRKAAVEALLTVLATRFGPVPVELADELSRIDDADQLGRWIRAAAAAPSLDDFVRMHRS